MKVIGFAGTAKNTGKTTTASKVLSSLRDEGACVAVTSIGYDGENIDNVTGLPKPLYYLKAGDIIATAAQCLKNISPSSYKFLYETEVQTILGAIQVIEIREPNTYTLAGPNRRSDLEIILKILKENHADFTLIDGALNRIVPMICADGIVISTGAAFDEQISSVAAHASGLSNLFTYQKVIPVDKHKHIHLVMDDGQTLSIPSSSLISQEVFEKLKAHCSNGFERLTIPGACYPDLLLKLFSTLPQASRPRELVLGNPLFLIASGNPVTWQEVLLNIETAGNKIGYCETLPLLFMTVNPFYPRYMQSTHTYEAAYVNASELLHEIEKKVINSPVINVEQITNQNLLHLLS